MTSINATTLRKDLFGMLNSAIQYNETIRVSTKEGNAVILSEEEYNGLLATLELSSAPALREKILAGKAEDPDDCVSMDEVSW